MSDSSDRPARPLLDPELLDRFLAGECAEAEAAIVRRTLMAHPEAARALARTLEELDDGAERPSAPDARASLAALRARQPAPTGPDLATLGQSAAADIGHMDPPWWEQRLRLRRGALMAAGVCLAALVGGAAIWGRRATSDGVQEASRLAGPTRTQGGALYVTAPGQRAEVLLRDGTRVRLAPASQLRVATDYGTGRRDVYLDGEAYFDVTHDARRPFTVFTANASAQDLGTQFSVRSYPGDGAVEVVVREGSVALSGVGPLEAGDVGRLTAKGRTDVRRGVDADSALGWLDGRLVFHDAPLADVLRDVGRWYDVDVSAEPALATLPFTGTLAGGSAAAAVELVAATLGLRVEHDGPRHVLQRELARTPIDTTAAPETH